MGLLGQVVPCPLSEPMGVPYVKIAPVNPSSRRRVECIRLSLSAPCSSSAALLTGIGTIVDSAAPTCRIFSERLSRVLGARAQLDKQLLTGHGAQTDRSVGGVEDGPSDHL